VVGAAIDDIEPAVGQIAQARRKPEPEQVAEPEHVLGCAASIGIMLPDGRGALMVEQSVQNVSGLASVSRDHLGVEWRKSVGDVGIELYAWL
jgi:hypothetical protein